MEYYYKAGGNNEISFVKLIGKERFRGSDAIKKGFAKFMEDAGIPYEPIGVEELRKRLAKANLAPDTGLGLVFPIPA